MLFVTGDVVSARSRTFLERTGSRWLSKPFNIGDVEAGMLAIPGVGPVVAAGWLVSTLVGAAAGAGVGAASGGVIGAMIMSLLVLRVLYVLFQSPVQASIPQPQRQDEEQLVEVGSF
jgi:hypothetical protein